MICYSDLPLNGTLKIQTFIIDGKTGQSIYSPFGGSLFTQMGGLTISMEMHGYDMYLFWTAECTNVEMFKKTGIQKGASSNLNQFLKYIFS